MIEFQNQLNEIKSLIMSTGEASRIWGLNQDSIKRLCREKKVACLKLDENDSKSPYIILRNQPNPKKQK